VAKSNKPSRTSKASKASKIEQSKKVAGDKAAAAKAGATKRPASPDPLLDFEQTVAANVEMKLLGKELDYLIGSGSAVTTRKEVLDFVSLGRQVLDDLEKLVS
jgi:hypothetical protein